MSVRNRCKGRVFDHVLKLMENNYHQLHLLCLSRFVMRGRFMSADDVLHETILQVVKDERASGICMDDEFVKYFMYRANMVVYQTIKDCDQEIKEEYAYYIQTKTSITDEW